ncbi:tetratricopeptide repeat protein [Methylobacter sp. BBA5.1]|uniref:YfgM family protein n=1 Tax=Methylobacter sp. BBA5.1 TaxID=1495064 RepID=UPI00056886EB|nr:tetratricopeptide repeat protein [Methylobacter sp. BBA5.1]
MAIYDTEEEQVEALKRWWKENGTSTIAGLVVGIALILGWNYWRSHNKEQAAQASALYDQLLTATDAGNKESAEKLAERTKEQFGTTKYALYSGLVQAKLKVQQGDLAAAKQILEGLAAKSDDELSHIARIRLVRLMLATGEHEQGLEVINKVDPASSSGFSVTYDELLGDLYVALDRRAEARTAYQNALRNGSQSPLLQLKIDDLTAPEIIQTQK